MIQDNGVPASPSGYSAEPEPSCTVSAVPVSIPNAVADLRKNAESLKQYMDSFYEAKREAHDSMFGRPYGIEERVGDLHILVQRLTVSVYHGFNAAASAIEARRAETLQDGSVHESATGEAGDAHPTPESLQP